ncbi:hypothetical protein GEMRC1_006102 [Eukaryota sp. GEM-RC1]
MPLHLPHQCKNSLRKIRTTLRSLHHPASKSSSADTHSYYIDVPEQCDLHNVVLIYDQDRELFRPATLSDPPHCINHLAIIPLTTPLKLTNRTGKVFLVTQVCQECSQYFVSLDPLPVMTSSPDNVVVTSPPSGPTSGPFLYPLLDREETDSAPSAPVMDDI